MSDLGLNKLTYRCQKMIWRVVQNRVAAEQSRQQRLLFHLCPARQWHWYNRWIIIKPNSLLLEDKRSQTSSEGHNQTSALPLLLLLLFVCFFLSQILQTNTIERVILMLEVLVNIAFKEVVLIHISVSVGNVSLPI